MIEPTHHFPFARRGSSRTTGLLVAIGVGLAAAGLVGYVALIRPRPEDAPRAKPPALPADLLRGGPAERGQGAATGVRIELADKDDPTRVSAVLLAKTVTPQKGRQAEVAEPGALIFLRDGRTLRIKARKGTFSSFSSDQAPERGQFMGEVKVMVYAPRETAARATDWDAVTPLLTADLGESFEFDLTFGRASVPGAFTIADETLRISGTQADLVLDEAGAALRSLAIAREVRIARTPAKSKPASETQAVASGPSAKAAPAPSLYKVTLSNAVRVVFGEGEGARTVDSNTAEGFMRLVGNRLPPGAIAKFDTDAASAAQPAQPAASASAAPGTPSADEAFTLTSEGPLEIKLTTQAPSELAQNDLFVRLLGAAEPVRFADGGSKATGSSPIVELGATRGDITMIGSTPDSIALTSPREGKLLAQWFSVNLPTKVGVARGPGSVTERAASATESTPTPTPAIAGDPSAPPSFRPRGVAWNEQADFELTRNAGRKTWDLKQTTLAGTVTGSDGQGAFDAEVLNATFAPRNQLLHATLSEGSAIRDGKGAILSAETIDLRLRELMDGKTEPEFLTAKGRVEGRDTKNVLSGGLLEASIVRDASNKLIVKDIVAKETVNYGGPDGITASAAELRADVPARKADLIGKGSSIVQGPSQVEGGLIKLDGLAKTLRVEGPGTFLTDSDGESKGLISARAGWTGSMSFDDKTGVLEALGGAWATAQPDRFTLDRMQADRVVVLTAPRAAAASPTSPTSPTATPTTPAEGTLAAQSGVTKTRDVVSVTAETVEGSGSGPARVESRMYETPVTIGGTEGARLGRVQSLEGLRIIANNLEGTLTVPTAGKALMFDRRSAEPANAAAPEGPFAMTGGFRGSALFEWNSSMSFARSTGNLDLLGAVKITNDRPNTASLFYLEADRVQAVVAGFETGAGKKPAGETLASADATGNVFARYKTAAAEREVNSFRAIYTAEKSNLRVMAAPGGEVSIFDSATATPVKAAELLWDLGKDRVEIVKPSPITTPR